MATNEELGRMPGVRVKEILNADLGISSPQFRIAGLVSTSYTSLLKRDIAVIRGAEDTDTIPGFESAEVTSVECISTYQEAYGTRRPALVKTTDYTVEGNVITFTEAGKLKVLEGDKYYVTATIDKVSEGWFEPKEMTDFSQVLREYGPEYSTEKGINPMVALSRILFNAGARRVVCVQSKSASKTDYESALDKLKEVELQYVLCNSTTQDVQNALLNHVVDMSTVENSMNRVGFTAPKTEDAEINEILLDATSFKTQNIVLVAPGKVLINVEDEQGSAYATWVSGIYGAAAIVGMLCNPNRRLATPLTRKNLTQYGIIDTGKHYKKQEIEKMAAAGVTVLIQRKSTNNIVVNQGLTTDNSNYGNYYLNVVCCKYEVARLLKEDLDDTFIGTEILTDTVTLVQSFIRSTLDGFRGIYINTFKDLSVARDADIPTKLNVSFKIAPIFGLDYIDISFSVYVD